MGGNIFKYTKRVTREEVFQVYENLRGGLLFGVRSELIGSSGKKDTSGDIDIAVDGCEYENIKQKVKEHYLPNEYKITKGLISVCEKVNGSYVQVDFIFGEIEWIKLFYFYDESSKLKGVHRNIALSTIAEFSHLRIIDGSLDSLGRPIHIHRYKWSPIQGLIYVERKSRLVNGKWIKKQDEKELSRAVKDSLGVSEVLFYGKLCDKYLISAEKAIEAVKIVYDKETAERIYDKIAKRFFEHSSYTESMEFPWEIKERIKNKSWIKISETS